VDWLFGKRALLGLLDRRAELTTDLAQCLSQRWGSVVLKIIAVLCSRSGPESCREQIVTTSDFADVSTQSCLMGAPQLADWMKQHPVERLAAWRCVIGKHDGRGA
jgi:hypothetical protein